MTSSIAYRTPFLSIVSIVVLCATASTARAGYTHYWTWRRPPDRAALARALGEMQALVAARRAILDVADGFDGGLEAPFGDAGHLPLVLFNGRDADAHETFAFPLAPFTAGDPSFQFVKTAQKPYDEVVTACLLVARDHFAPDQLSIRSDGRFDPDWRPGALLYERVLGRTARDPLSAPDPATRPAPAPTDDGGEAERARAHQRFYLSAIALLALAIVALLFRRR